MNAGCWYCLDAIQQSIYHIWDIDASVIVLRFPTRQDVFCIYVHQGYPVTLCSFLPTLSFPRHAYKSWRILKDFTPYVNLRIPPFYISCSFTTDQLLYRWKGDEFETPEISFAFPHLYLNSFRWHPLVVRISSGFPWGSACNTYFTHWSLPRSGCLMAI